MLCHNLHEELQLIIMRYKPVVFLNRSVTSLGHQEESNNSLGGAQFFELCPIVLNDVQYILQGPRGGKNFSREIHPSWLRACS